MSYTPTKWINGVTPLNAQNMNNIEYGITNLFTLPSNNYINTPITNLSATPLNIDTPNNGYYIISLYGGNNSDSIITVECGYITLEQKLNKYGRIYFMFPIKKGVKISIRSENTMTLTYSSASFHYSEKV